MEAAIVCATLIYIRAELNAELIGSRWVNKGTAARSPNSEDINEALLVARAERNYDEIILSTAIRAEDVYHRQQDPVDHDSTTCRDVFNDHQTKTNSGPCFGGARVAILQEIAYWVISPDGSKMYVVGSPSESPLNLPPESSENPDV
ncbi:hypothetical protein M378DRAFT_17989 [Amanita muscaria Koide BX008]|uniref:Uncharacterized protein n=1 Tax=Amanita muscaria (strain Koide BX008) TaxID=946122 RepID=A0A0C2WH04_AMAMK|nr:hypothetical protein M378DRAFT_17989 [Amanita muscaria Koide BX008]